MPSDSRTHAELIREAHRLLDPVVPDEDLHGKPVHILTRIRELVRVHQEALAELAALKAKTTGA